ncbi:hypothetical protein JW766_00620 [Candidatus Dojkabacteria bacterium]|nr:hypothetical protein [Candidatus Dojkabacteria bacterium]
MDKKKKILIAVAVVLLACPLFGYGAAKLFLLPASPNKVCQHMWDLTEKELKDIVGEEEAKKMLEEEMGSIDECVKDEKKRRENSTKGMLEIKKEADCILDAKSLEDLEKCD